MRIGTWPLAFVLGACAGTAATTVASPADPVAPPVVAPRPPTVVPLDRAERRVAPPGTASVALLARGQNAFIGLLRMDAGGRVPTHRDATEEYIHVLSGGGTLTIDGAAHTLKAGTTVFMPAEAEVHFQNGDVELVALQVFAGPEPAAKYDAWASP